MNLQEIIEKWMLNERDTTPLWKLAINDIEYEGADDPTDAVEIAALAENIRRIGLIHPIIVCRQKKGKKYKLISGRRRLEAIKVLGRTHIAAIVVKSEGIQPVEIALSENMMRRSPHFLDLAKDIGTLLEIYGTDKTARLFTLNEVQIREMSLLNSLSAYEKRLIRLLKFTKDDAIALSAIENNELRKLILEKIMASGDSCDPSKLIKTAVQSPDLRVLQSEKIYMRDVRVFLNTVERAAETMSAAGYDTKIEHIEDDDRYEFKIVVSKKSRSACPKFNTKRNNAAAHPDVSRETSDKKSSPWALGSKTVSRETFENPQLTIDECVKS